MTGSESRAGIAPRAGPAPCACRPREITAHSIRRHVRACCARSSPPPLCGQLPRRNHARRTAPRPGRKKDRPARTWRESVQTRYDASFRQNRASSSPPQACGNELQWIAVPSGSDFDSAGCRIRPGRTSFASAERSAHVGTDRAISNGQRMPSRGRLDAPGAQSPFGRRPALLSRQPPRTGGAR